MSKTNKNDIDRLPPHAPEAEMGVCGCVLQAPSGCLDELDETGFQPEWCYDLRHQLILKTARAMHFRQPRVEVDLITLQSELRQTGQLEEIGGLMYLNHLIEQTPSAANLPAYVAEVREKWQLRSVVSSCTDIIGRVYECEGDVDELLEQLQGDIGRLAELRTNRTEVKIRQLLRDRVMPKLEGHYTRGRSQMSGLVSTGLEYLDKIFCGLGGDNGNYHVIGARPNVGKTSLVTGIALHAALDFEFVEEISEEQAGQWSVVSGQLPGGGFNTPFQSEGKWFVKRKGVPVGISSLEMASDSLAFKMLFQRAKSDLQLWRTGFAKEQDFPPLIKAAGELSAPDNILIDDTPRDNIASIKAKWRRWHRQYGVRFFMLDYIQLIKSTSKRFRQDRVQEMEDISAELQALANKELKCPCLILAQLNRDYEKEPNRLPRMSDLKNCGAIEQDADTITFLYKPSPFKPFSKEYTEDYEFFAQCMEQKFGESWRKWSGRPERINALVEKNKHGPKGDAQLLFLKSSTLFVDYDAWLKRNGFKGAAKGESQYKAEGRMQNEESGSATGNRELPTDEELGFNKKEE